MIRVGFIVGQTTLDSSKLVFIDEAGVGVAMTRCGMNSRRACASVGSGAVATPQHAAARLYHPAILPRRLEGRIQASAATGAQGPRLGATGCRAMYQNLRRRFW